MEYETPQEDPTMTSTRLLPAALLALMGTGAAHAQTMADSPFSITSLQYGETYLATTLIGTRVHAIDQDMTIDPLVALPAGTVAEWDDIGEIGDMVIGVDGTLRAVVVDVGGFLGLGEREVALDWGALIGVREDDDPDEWFLGVRLPEEALENAPELEREPVRPMN